VTLNDREWPLYVKFCVCTGMYTHFCVGLCFEKNCVKSNKGRPTLAAAKMFSTLVSGDIRGGSPNFHENFRQTYVYLSLRNIKNIYIMIWTIPDQMARGELFQRAMVTAVTDKFRIARFCVLLRGFLVQ